MPAKSPVTGLRSKIKIFIILAFVGVFAVLVSVASLFIVEIEDIIYADAKIIPEHTFEVVSHVDARIIKLNYKTGQDVIQGAVIAELDTKTYENDALAAESAIKELEAELEVKKAELAVLEKEPLPKELWHAETNLKECQDKTVRSKDRLERAHKLKEMSAISQIELEKAELEYIQAKAELERATANARRVNDGIAKQTIEKAKRDIGLVSAKLDGKKATLELLKRQIEECKIIAPATGKIIEMPCKSTMYVERGKVAAKIASGDETIALAQVDERVVRKVRLGQPARGSSEVYNRLQYGSFSGEVKRIWDVPIQGTDGSGIKYPVEVRLDSDGFELKYGSRLEVGIITGKQPAIYALLNLSPEEAAAREKIKRSAMKKQALKDKSSGFVHTSDVSLPEE